MSKLIDMTGWVMKDHGVPESRLTVIRRAEDSKNGQVQWLCECDCEEHNQKILLGTSIRKGHTLSCGCLSREKASERAKQKFPMPVYNIDGEYGIGYTSKGEEFWFDIEDYELIQHYRWYYDSYGYLAASAKIDNEETIIRLHRLVMGDVPKGMVIDHKTHPPRNGHKVDNRKSNLRIVTRRVNGRNAALKSNNTTGVSGVNYEEKIQKYRVRISTEDGVKYLGVYENFDDAVQVRLNAEKQYYKDARYDAYN